MEHTFQRIATNGITVRAMVRGDGPLIVLVHGWPESWYSWRHQIEPLVQAGYRVAAIDVRGYGGSDKPEAIEAYSMREITSDVAGVIDALGVGGNPAILIGHDWGAPIVWTTAILHRPKVRAVVGMSVPHLARSPKPAIDMYRSIFAGKFFYQIYFQEPGVAERELEADIPATLRKTYYGASGDCSRTERAFLSEKTPESTFLEGMVDPDPLPKWLSEAEVEYYASQFRQSGFRGPLNRYRNSERDWSELPQLATEKVTQPALFIAGEADPVLRFSRGKLLHEMMDPYYTDLRGKVLIPRVGHWVQQEAPAPVNAALLDFLKGL